MNRLNSVFLLGLLALASIAQGQELSANECRHYEMLLSKYEREGVTSYNGITGQVQRLSDDQSRLRIERIRQIIREKCRY